MRPPCVRGEDVQRQMLSAEGISFLADGRVDLQKCGFRPEEI